MASSAPTPGRSRAHEPGYGATGREHARGAHRGAIEPGPAGPAHPARKSTSTPRIDSGRVDGVYGEKTGRAARAFQEQLVPSQQALRLHHAQRTPTALPADVRPARRRRPRQGHRQQPPGQPPGRRRPALRPLRASAELAPLSEADVRGALSSRGRTGPLALFTPPQMSRQPAHPATRAARCGPICYSAGGTRALSRSKNWATRRANHWGSSTHG